MKNTAWEDAIELLIEILKGQHKIICSIILVNISCGIWRIPAGNTRTPAGGKNAHKGFTEISPQMGVILVQVLEFEWCYSGPWMVGYKF